MSAYRPTDIRLVAALLVVLLVVLLGGYALTRRDSRHYGPKLGWGALVLGVVGIERVCSGEPPGFRMLALIAFALLTLKLLAVLNERANGMAPLSLAAWFGFATAWLGMQPRLFASHGGPPLDGAAVLLRRGAVNAAVGIALIVLARATWLVTESRLLATIPLLVGLSFCLHFGIGSLLAGAWRMRGVPACAPFRAPLRATSLAEFWARRWNLGFSEMTATLLYRPLSERLGKSPALLMGFVWSGLLHEMAISVPVRAGLGLPFLYFSLHGALVWVERSLSRAGRPLSGWSGRAWSIFWILAPLPLLFHRPFLAGVIWPLIGIR